MKLKFTLPYVMLGTALMFTDSSTAQTDVHADQNAHIKLPRIEIPTQQFKLALANPTPVMDIAYQYKMDEMYLAKKADVLVDKYMANMLAAQGKLHPLLGTSGYRAAVRRELPGAPVGMHCVYGQYTQLNRAVREMGDTLTIIPQAGSRACIMFKDQMRRKYKAPEYADAIHEGRMYESDSLYDAALAKYMTQRGIKADAPDSVRQVVAEKFAKTNFSAQQLSPGTILIVPRYRGSRSKFHAIMFLGRGRIENGKFVADPNGRYIYTGHNRENIGDLFKTWDTSNTFAADTREIARAEYAKEWSRIETMSREELIEYLAQDKSRNRTDLQLLTRPMLLQMARSAYFKNCVPALPRTEMPYDIVAQTPRVKNPMLQKMLLWQTQRTI